MEIKINNKDFSCMVKSEMTSRSGPEITSVEIGKIKSISWDNLNIGEKVAER